MTLPSRLLLAACVVIGLSACHDPDKYCKRWIDQNQRQQIFIQCIREAKQPTANHEDNNGHLVEACEDAAEHQAMHQKSCEYGVDTEQ
jgi:hypothetical protein